MCIMVLTEFCNFSSKIARYPTPTPPSPGGSCAWSASMFAQLWWIKKQWENKKDHLKQTQESKN